MWLIHAPQCGQQSNLVNVGDLKVITFLSGVENAKKTFF